MKWNPHKFILPRFSSNANITKWESNILVVVHNSYLSIFFWKYHKCNKRYHNYKNIRSIMFHKVNKIVTFYLLSVVLNYMWMSFCCWKHIQMCFSYPFFCYIRSDKLVLGLTCKSICKANIVTNLARNNHDVAHNDSLC